MDFNVLGIDPGRTGALVLLGSGCTKVLKATRFPLKDKDIDRRRLLDTLSSWKEAHGIHLVSMERVHARASNGSVAAFAFGKYSECLKMALVANDLEWMEVLPQKWQQGLEIPPKVKGQPAKQRTDQIKAYLTALARDTWPDLPIQFKADWGMADAVLIARYGLEAS